MNLLITRTLVAGALCVLLASCANEQTRSSKTKLTPIQLSQARWDAIYAKDYNVAYEFMSPATKSAIDVDDYRFWLKKKPVVWEKTNILSEECSEQVCKVQIQLFYSIPPIAQGVGRMKMDSQVTESWVKTDNHWWFVPPKK